MAIYINCVRCGAPNDEHRRREGATGGMPAYRCGSCGVRFNANRVISEAFHLEQGDEPNRFRLHLHH